MATEPRLEHQTLKVRQLVEEYRGGRIVIPEFQREYVWRRSKAPLLIDSLYRGFPISSLLLWQSSDETRSRRRDPRPQRAAVMSWLIDGQQRVITLHRHHQRRRGHRGCFQRRRGSVSPCQCSDATRRQLGTRVGSLG